MIFEKDGIKIRNNSPECDNLFVRQGWVLVEDKEEVDENPTPSTETQQGKPATKRTTKINK